MDEREDGMFGRVGWYICRVYTVVYPLFKTAIHDRPGRWPTATTFAKSAEIIVSPQRVFIHPMPAHRLTLISTFWLPPPFSLRASLRAFPPTVFSPSHLLFFNVRADRGRDVSCVEPTWFGKKKKKKEKGTGSEFLNYTTPRDGGFLPWRGERSGGLTRFAEFLGEQV